MNIKTSIEKPGQVEKQQQILKARAQKLAKPKETLEQVQDFIEVIVFNLSQEQYGIESKYVKEVYPLKDYTFLPCVPPFIFGLINVRRRILSVVDLKVFFSLPTETTSSTTEKKVIIIQGYDMEFGILCDQVKGIYKIPIDQIQSALPTLKGSRLDFAKGMTLDRIMILDAGKLLTSKEILVDETVEI